MPLGQVEGWNPGHSAAQHCALSVLIFFSFLLIIPEIWIKFKKHRKYNKTQKNMK
jgi:hypothetical protein